MFCSRNLWFCSFNVWIERWWFSSSKFPGDELAVVVQLDQWDVHDLVPLLQLICQQFTSICMSFSEVFSSLVWAYSSLYSLLRCWCRKLTLSSSPTASGSHQWWWCSSSAPAQSLLLTVQDFSSSSSSALCFSMPSCLSPSALCSNSRIRWNVFRELCWLHTPQTGVRGACPGARDPAAGPHRLPSAASAAAAGSHAACPWPPAGSGVMYTVRWARCSGSSVEFSTCSLAFWVCSMVVCSCRKALCFCSVRIWLLKAMFWVSKCCSWSLSCIVPFQLAGQVLRLKHLYGGFLMAQPPALLLVTSSQLPAGCFKECYRCFPSSWFCLRSSHFFSTWSAFCSC